MADCDGRRYMGELDGFVGAHHCARARAEKIWADVNFPHVDLVTRFWDYNGNLARAVDAGEITAYEMDERVETFNPSCPNRCKQ